MTRRRPPPSRTIATGVVAGLMVVVFTVSFAGLIHAGAPTGALPVLIALFLGGAVVANLVAARWSALPGVIVLPQGPPAAVATAALLTLLPGVAGEDRLGTAIVFVGLACALTGVAMLVLGSGRFEDLLARVPKPVAGGLLAGTGLILLMGGARLASNEYRWSTATALSFAGAVLFALVVVALVRRRPGAPLFPILVVVAFGLFHLVLALSGMSTTAAREAGILLSDASSGLVLPISDLGRADFGAIASGWGGLLMMPLVALLGLSLNVRAMELLRSTEVDLRRELRVSGVANGLAALTGASAGYPSLGLMAIGLRNRVSGPLLTITAATVTAVAIVAIGSLVSLMPTSLVAGLLLGVGLSLAADWFLDASRSMRPAEQGLMALLAVGMALGWFEIVLGLAAVGGIALSMVDRRPAETA